eukprot:snap_masked-scaffold_13-processed-gene-8.43-mRNA-1 protein AED:1.00 eAED:1.00 QI:0/-1/0/0/-1/1/1/0/262
MKFLKVFAAVFTLATQTSHVLAITKKHLAKVVVESKATGCAGLIEALVSPDYVEHNCSYVDGRDSLIQAVESGSFETVNVVRALEEDNLVVLHVDYGEYIVFEVFRFENWRIVEHWDNWQLAVSAENSANGNSMIDGETRISSANATENYEFVNFVYGELVARAGNLTALLELSPFYRPDYIQHNPTVTNGFEPVAQAFSFTPFQAVEELHVSEGNFVFVAMDYLGVFVAFDLFRVEDLIIQEHWDTIEPPAFTCANGNGKF